MASRFLTIDATNPGRFYVAVEDAMLSLGADSTHMDGVIRNIRVKRIHCEFEVNDEPIEVLQISADGPNTLTLEINEELNLNTAKLHVLPALEASGAGVGAVARRFVVVDGADMGRMFPVNASGVTRIGKNPKTSHIALNDLYASQVHCEVVTEGEHVFVNHIEGSSGTFINRHRITGRTEIHVGDLLRIGNTHLRLELGVVVERRDKGSGEKPILKDGVEKGSGERPALREAVVGKIGANSPPPEPTPMEKVVHLENQTLGHFQLASILGRGQSGVVFRAIDLKTNQTLALKVLSPEFPKSEAEIQSFTRALKLMPVGRDPHVLPLHGVGKTGLFTWLSRDYVDGYSLETYHAKNVEEGKLSWKRACRTIAQIAAGLDFLHRHHVVHGNLTPRNILIGREDKVAHITDVLLRQALEGTYLRKVTQSAKRQAEMMFYGPEQLVGKGACDARTDLYSLGVLFYMMVTGNVPYTGISEEEIFAKITEEKLVKPSRREKGLPAPIEAVIVKLLAADPNDRYQSVAELLEVIEPIVMMYDSKA